VTEQFDRQWRALAHSALRIAAGLAYFSHGSQKLLGWFGGFGPGGGSAELLSRFGVAGTIETIAGALLIMGLFTRPVAFIASGEMAVTYFWMHWGGSGQVFWWQNHGETPLLYCFIWFLFAAWGPGAFSLDAWIRKQPTPSGG
jgi:putative oxidoreductase